MEVLQKPQDMGNEKKVWQSKTFWVSVIAAIAPAFPPVAAIIAANPELFSTALGVIFTGLRLVTKDRVVIK